MLVPRVEELFPVGFKSVFVFVLAVGGATEFCGMRTRSCFWCFRLMYSTVLYRYLISIPAHTGPSAEFHLNHVTAGQHKLSGAVLYLQLVFFYSASTSFQSRLPHPPAESSPRRHPSKGQLEFNPTFFLESMIAIQVVQASKSNI